MPNLVRQGTVEFMGGARRSREGTVNAAKGLDEPDRRRDNPLCMIMPHDSCIYGIQKTLRNRKVFCKLNRGHLPRQFLDIWHHQDLDRKL